MIKYIKLIVTFIIYLSIFSMGQASDFTFLQKSIYDQRVAAGDSHERAMAYSNYLILSKDSTNVDEYSNLFMTRLQSGDSVEKAHAYASYVSGGGDQTLAETYSKSYTESRSLGYSRKFSHAYACRMAIEHKNDCAKTRHPLKTYKCCHKLLHSQSKTCKLSNQKK